MNEQDTQFYPLATLEKITRPLLWVLSLLLIVTSIWGFADLLAMGNQPLELVFGNPGEVREEIQDGRTSYSLAFTHLETGEEMTYRLRNNSPVLDYMIDASPAITVAIRYRTDDRTITEIYPTVYGIPQVRDRVTPPGILLGASLLGLGVALVLLFPGMLDRILYRAGQRSNIR
jgi:hypothetical protein